MRYSIDAIGIAIGNLPVCLVDAAFTLLVLLIFVRGISSKPISKIEQRLKEQQRGSNNKNEKVPCRWPVIFDRAARTTYFVGEPRVLLCTEYQRYRGPTVSYEVFQPRIIEGSSTSELARGSRLLFATYLFSGLYFLVTASMVVSQESVRTRKATP